MIALLALVLSSAPASLARERGSAAAATPLAIAQASRWAWCWQVATWLHCEGDRDYWTFHPGPLWCWWPPLDRLFEMSLRLERWNWCLTDTRAPGRQPTRGTRA